ncbi:MAG TPA: extracellular solute-binding protein [Candidatus Acidoferrales bacterium]|nr:extracellular solute-binding protein [Candidatus Acidoferrales bacterium]
MRAKAAITLAMTVFLAWLVDARADWKSDWEKIVAAAKKEGRLNLYVGRYGQEALLAEFKKEYPEIKLVTVNGTGNQLATRIVAEARGGKTIADLYSGGPNSSFNFLYRGKLLDSIKAAFILPEVVDESKWYGARHTFTDPEGQFIFIYVALPGSRGLAYNSTRVDPREFNSYWDLTQPKWKGKMVSQRPTETGLSAHLQFYYYHPELGPNFIRRLFGEMDMTFGDRRMITDWLAAGKFAICHGCREIEKAHSQGLPVDDFDTGGWKEGEALSTGGGSISLIKGGPHPHAARVFINWFLSRKGQIALQSSKDLYGEHPPNSRRIDIPKDMLPRESRLVEGRKYLDVARPEFSDMAAVSRLAREIMKAREQ